MLGGHWRSGEGSKDVESRIDCATDVEVCRERCKNQNTSCGERGIERKREKGIEREISSGKRIKREEMCDN